MSDTKIPRYIIVGQFELREDVNGTVCMSHEVTPLEEMVDRLREANIQRRWPGDFPKTYADLLPPKPDRTKYREDLFVKVLIEVLSCHLGNLTPTDDPQDLLVAYAMKITDAAIAALDA